MGSAAPNARPIEGTDNTGANAGTTGTGDPSMGGATVPGGTGDRDAEMGTAAMNDQGTSPTAMSSDGGVGSSDGGAGSGASRGSNRSGAGGNDSSRNGNGSGARTGSGARGGGGGSANGGGAASGSGN